MADKAKKELRRMSRRELIEIIYAMQQEDKELSGQEPASDEMPLSEKEETAGEDSPPEKEENSGADSLSEEGENSGTDSLSEEGEFSGEDSLSEEEIISGGKLPVGEDLPSDKKTEAKTIAIPGEEAVEAERNRLEYRKRFRKTLRSTVYALLVVAAVAVLVATLFLPVLQVSGSSMEPTLEDQDIIILYKSGTFETGDLVGFYYQNKLLLKRVIAGPGDVVDIDEDGNVYVNDELLDEPYVTEKCLGESDLTYPYQVPENRYFVMGDNRSTSVDSRSSTIGCVDVDQIVGKVFLRIWPLERMTVF